MTAFADRTVVTIAVSTVSVNLAINLFFFFSLQCLSFLFHSKLLSYLKIHNNSFLNVLLGANSDYLQRHTSLCSIFVYPF